MYSIIFCSSQLQKNLHEQWMDVSIRFLNDVVLGCFHQRVVLINTFFWFVLYVARGIKQ